MYKFIIPIATLLFISCNHLKDADDAHSHEEADHIQSSIQSTLFSGEYEYFIEYDALEPGQPSSFLVHVTGLETYDPITEGSMTINIGDKEAKVDEPSRPGIFQLEIIPDETGEFPIKYTLVTSNGKDIMYARVHISDGHDHETHAEEEETGHSHQGEEQHEHSAADHEDEDAEHVEEAVGELLFLKEQAWKSDFMVKEIQPAAFSGIIRASGEIDAVPGLKKHLPASSSGVLIFLNNRLVEGSWVDKGEPMFVISAAALDDSNFELRYRELKNNLESSRSVFLRHKKLYAEQVIPEKTFIESRTSYYNDSLRYYNLSTRVTASGIRIIAPISGYIHELNFADGQYVNTGDQIVTISTNQRLLLRADVPMQHYPMVPEIVSANFRSAYSSRIYDIDSLGGVLLARGSSVAENNHFIPVYFEVENDGSLLEGAYVEFFLKTAAEENVLLVPATAILEEAGNHYVYVQVTGESYTKRGINTGHTDGKKIEVTDGLNQGERVVTRGVMLLKASTLVSGETGHGHAH